MRINVTLPSSALSVDAVLSTLRRPPPPSPPRHLAANVPFATANFAVPVTTTFLPNGKVDTRLLDTVASSHLRPPSFLGAPPPAFYDSLRYQQKPPFPHPLEISSHQPFPPAYRPNPLTLISIAYENRLELQFRERRAFLFLNRRDDTRKLFVRDNS